MDELAQEELEERRCMLKGLHPVMKTWYNSTEAAPIKTKYGDFPMFWQDLESWQHLKLLRKIYLTVSEKKDSGTTFDLMEVENSFLVLDTAVEDVPIPNAESAVNGSSSDKLNDTGEATEGNKKRRSKWSAAPDALAGSIVQSNPLAGLGLKCNDVTAHEDDKDTSKKQRRSRWTTGEENASIPTLSGIIQPPAPISQEVVQQSMVLKVQLQQVADKLLTVVQDAIRIDLDPNRPPSPPPKYDSNGKRINTREVRMREELMENRAKIIEELMKINPQYAAPVDFVRTKPFRRIMIPFREFPTYNFIGLIIGPRGNTQKKLESETGCKISIRGKGSSKEGSKGRAAKSADDDEDLHVHVTGDDAEKVALAAKMVEDLLRPVDDDKNEHKQKQLRELALINGTLKEEEYCPVCGEKGHRQFECPHRGKTFKAAGVKCSICGDLSHPTRDCPLKKDDPTNAVMLDSEYDSFMAELGDGKPSASSGLAKSSSSSSSSGNGVETVYIDGVTPPQPMGQVIVQPMQLPKRQQTIIHVTTVLTGTVPLVSMTGSTGTITPAIYSTATATGAAVAAAVPSIAPVQPVGIITPSPWASSGTMPGMMPPGMPNAPTVGYAAYDPYGQQTAMYGYAGQVGNNQYYDYTAYQHQQQQQQYGGGYFNYNANTAAAPPPPDSIGVAPAPPPPPPPSDAPPAPVETSSPWLTTDEEQKGYF